MGSEWIQSLLTYRSIKYIQVKDWRLVAVQYSIQLAILIYIIGYTVIYAKGYQSSETAISAIYTKVKGSGIQFGGKSALFDAVDLVLPPVEQNALFITTSYIETINQTRSLNCVGTIEDFTSKDFKSCTDENKNLACTKDTFSANGKRTGNCAKSKSNSSFCELEAWCPIEDDDNGKEIRIPNVKDWTILVRANVLWPGFGYSTSNTQGDVKPVFGKSIFKVVDIVNETGYDFDSIVSSGMEVLVSIRFDCDSDKDEKCLPVFKFTR
jgi:hypothetical protein